MSFTCVRILTTLVALSSWVWEPAIAQGSCKKINSCSCKLDDGTVIDLSPVADSGKAKFLDQWDTNYVSQYSYNPCKEFSEGSCSGVSVCQYTGSDYYECGTQSSATFSNDPKNPNVVNIQYQSLGGDGVTRTSQVTLNCVQSGPDSLDVLGENPTTPAFYNFQLNSVHCCPKKGGSGGSAAAAGISIGSILVIIFFVVLVSYFALGVAFQKFVRKASGREVVPNVNLWVATPGLIKDGALFVVKRGKYSGEYNKI
ncbi:hypothetical protein RRG08_012536 [Elysia crispata]|uniref:Autophagy-related protein 27 n=1 Tax=Elysia crispata TaxID=231223 RepID=A0AAE1E1Y3_9GAST|nr:hypothetical protein RRG08_012536 [Elysia crispata]